jgi:hypothetical protein
VAKPVPIAAPAAAPIGPNKAPIAAPPVPKAILALLALANSASCCAAFPASATSPVLIAVFFLCVESSNDETAKIEARRQLDILGLLKKAKV